MCYALLTTCRVCAWLLTVSYPRCSHAKVYAVDPSACPHRMRRRNKASGLCTTCKANRQDARKGSLSVTPCEVRIEFRDTEVGAVDENDKVGRKRSESGDTEGQRVEDRDRSVVEDMDRRGRQTRARKGVVQSRAESPFDADSDDGDVYVDNPSPQASVSSAASDDELDDMLLPRKHKAGARPGPKALPKKRGPTRKRMRSPGVLERVQTAGAGAKKRRGRPPKVMVWPDRIDAGELEQVENERRATQRSEKIVERPLAKPKKTEKQPLLARESVLCERLAPPTIREPSWGQPQSYFIQQSAGTSTMSGHVQAVNEADDLARIIALEASKRDKKWR